MPTYEYKCDKCDHSFEVFQSMSDEPVKSCEKCGHEVRKVFNSTGIIFKGSGFYVNDYKNNGGATKEKSEGSHTCSSGCCCSAD